MARRSARMTRRRMLARAMSAAVAASLPARALARQPGGTRRVAITIDDGPVTGAGRELESFLRISDQLRECFVAEKVPVIMFLNERQLNLNGQRDARVSVLHKWLDAGFDLGNHTYSHVRLSETRLRQYLDDIIKGEVVSRPLLEARGKKLLWFRYPYLASGSGETARAVEEFLLQRGYRIAPVSVDYHDYRYTGTYMRYVRAGQEELAEQQFATVLKVLDDAFARSEARSVEVLGYELAQVLLIHCNEMNALTLRRTIQRMRDRGYQFVALDDAMEDQAYQLPGIPPGGLGGGGLFNSLAAAKRGGGP